MRQPMRPKSAPASSNAVTKPKEGPPTEKASSRPIVCNVCHHPGHVAKACPGMVVDVNDLPTRDEAVAYLQEASLRMVVPLGSRLKREVRDRNLPLVAHFVKYLSGLKLTEYTHHRDQAKFLLLAMGVAPGEKYGCEVAIMALMEGELDVVRSFLRASREVSHSWEYNSRIFVDKGVALGYHKEIQQLISEGFIHGDMSVPKSPWGPKFSGQGDAPPLEGKVDSESLTASIMGTLLRNICDEMEAGNVSKARDLIRTIPAASLRRFVDLVPPNRCDVYARLYYDSRTVDTARYVQSIHYAEEAYRWRSFRGSRLVPEWPVPLIRLWEKGAGMDLFPMRVVEEDQFESDYLHLFRSLPQRSRPARKWAFVTRDEFMENLRAFTGLDVEALELPGLNVLIGGGCIAACLQYEAPTGANAKDRAAYFHTQYPESDIDLFPLELCCSEWAADGPRRLKRLIDCILRASGCSQALVLVQTHCIVVVRAGRRLIQIHMGDWITLREVLCTVDVDCCAVVYDGAHVYTTPRGHFAWTRRVNLCDEKKCGVRGSPEYEKRLVKYALRGFSVVDINVMATDKRVADSIPATTSHSLYNYSGLLWLATVDRHGVQCVTGGSRARKFSPRGKKLRDIAEDTLSHGYNPSDGYGTHEDGYMVCLAWCRNLNLIQKFPGAGDEIMATWDEFINKAQYLCRLNRSSEVSRRRAPPWFQGIAGLDTGRSGCYDEYS